MKNIKKNLLEIFVEELLNLNEFFLIIENFDKFALEILSSIMQLHNDNANYFIDQLDIYAIIYEKLKNL